MHLGVVFFFLLLPFGIADGGVRLCVCTTTMLVLPSFGVGVIFTIT